MKNFTEIMKQAAKLQSELADSQAELEKMEVQGVSGGGMVILTLNAHGTLKNVRIDPSLFKSEEKEILEDLIVAAHHDAKQKAEKAASEKMSDLVGGMPLPPGFKPGL